MLITFDCPKCQSSLETEATAAGSEVECPQCQTSLTVPKRGVEPGTTVGGFRVEKRLGEGAMGQVFLARQLSTDRNVALKILPPEFTIREHLVQRFQNEVRIAARLEHQNIVTVYEAGEDSGIHFLAMGYVKGEPLDEKLEREGAMPQTEALQMVGRLAEALTYAWEEHRIVHRDIKPSNIMVDQRGEPKLTDMGLSKSMADDSGMTLSGTVMGTPNYMSPEQATGETELDFHTDMYSLGATLYHMLTGKIPFGSSSVVEVLQKQVSESLPDPRQFSPGISEACVGLMEIMLAKEPGQRYPDWDALRTDIDRALKGHQPSQVVPAVGQSVLLRSGGPKHPAPARHRKVVVGHSTMKRLRGAGSLVREPRKRTPKYVVPVIAGVVGLAVVAGVGIPLLMQKRRQDQARRIAEAKAAEQAQAEALEEQKQQEREFQEQKAREEKRLALEKRLSEAIEYAGKHPDDYAGATAKFERLRREAEGTEFEQPPSPKGYGVPGKAAKEIKRIEAARQQAVATVVAQLRKNAEGLSAQGKTEEAISLVREYKGEFAGATSEARTSLAESLGRRAAEAEVATAKRREASAGKVRALLDAIADDLLKLDFAAVRTHISAAETDESFSPDPDAWNKIKERVTKVSAMPEVILASFVEDKGREVTVHLAQGTERVQIVDVGSGKIEAKRLIKRQGRVVGASGRNIRLEDLSVNEKLRRLGSDRTAELDIMRGLLAYEVKAHAKADEYFRRSDCPVGKLLHARIERLLSEQESAASARRAAATEAEAEKAYDSLLRTVGLAASEKDIGKVATAIRKMVFTKDQIGTISESLERFRSQYAETDVAKDRAAIFEVLDRIRPNMALSVDQETVDQAMAKLKKGNPGLDDLPKVQLTADGIITTLDLTGKGRLSDISALAGLPIRSLIADSTNVSDLRPLTGMPLRKLSFLTSQVSDLTPLKGMPLTDLRLGGDERVGASDLRPLEGMALTRLSLGGTDLTDLSPLKGMPLKNLWFSRGRGILLSQNSVGLLIVNDL